MLTKISYLSMQLTPLLTRDLSLSDCRFRKGLFGAEGAMLPCNLSVKLNGRLIVAYRIPNDVSMLYLSDHSNEMITLGLEM
jgi:hypothetical protein